MNHFNFSLIVLYFIQKTREGVLIKKTKPNIGVNEFITLTKKPCSEIAAT